MTAVTREEMENVIRGMGLAIAHANALVIRVSVTDPQERQDIIARLSDMAELLEESSPSVSDVLHDMLAVLTQLEHG
jgi:hypothetical protein